MDLRLVLGQHPSLIIIESLFGSNIVLCASTDSIIIGSIATMFKGIDPGEATSIGGASSMVTNHDGYIEVRKTPQYGTWDSYIEGSTSRYDSSRYQYGTSSST